MIDNQHSSSRDKTQQNALLRHWPRLRLLLLALVVASIYLTVNKMGLLQQTDSESIRKLIAQSGFSGVLVFFLVFTVGQLLYIPGMVFVAAAGLAFGQNLGMLYGMIGAAISITVSFYLVRYVGGTPLATTRRPWVRRAMAKLETQPFKSIFVMRVLFSTGPWLNYMLAMSSVKYRHYISASVLGIIPQAAITVYFADWLFQFA